MSYKGIDVSHHQGKINWADVGKTDLNFVIVRTSYGTTGRDSRYKENITGAKAHGLHVGAYHFSYATTVDQAKKEAKNFLASIKPYKLDYPVVFDLEYNDDTKKALSKWTDMAVAFLEILESNGYFAALYSDKYSLETRFNAKKIAPYSHWVAQWSSANTYKQPWGIWQYSATGKVPGISTAVDLNQSKYDYAKIIKNAGLNKN